MTTYQSHLPEVFPHRILTRDRGIVNEVIKQLLDGGTSFAVTVDKPTTIWLSEASLTILTKVGLAMDPRNMKVPDGKPLIQGR